MELKENMVPCDNANILLSALAPTARELTPSLTLGY